MPQILLKLTKLTCNQTSFGPGADSIYVIALLTDPKNNNRVLGTAVKAMGDMDHGDAKTNVELINLLPSPGIDGLRCIMGLVKVGPLGSLDPAAIQQGAQETINYLSSLTPGQAPNVPGQTWVDILIDGLLKLVWKVKGSWGSTVSLGSDDVTVAVPPGGTINGMHPGGSPPYYEFRCAGYDSNYDVQFTIFCAGY